MLDANDAPELQCNGTSKDACLAFEVGETPMCHGVICDVPAAASGRALRVRGTSRDAIVLASDEDNMVVLDALGAAVGASRRMQNVSLAIVDGEGGDGLGSLGAFRLELLDAFARRPEPRAGCAATTR